MRKIDPRTILLACSLAIFAAGCDVVTHVRGTVYEAEWPTTGNSQIKLLSDREPLPEGLRPLSGVSVIVARGLAGGRSTSRDDGSFGVGFSSSAFESTKVTCMKEGYSTVSMDLALRRSSKAELRVIMQRLP